MDPLRLHPRLRPFDLGRYLRELLGEGRVLEQKRLVTDDGWPFDLILVGPALRTVAVYHLGHHIAAAVVEGPAPEDYFTSARPDFRDPAIVPCLAELWT